MGQAHRHTFAWCFNSASPSAECKLLLAKISMEKKHANGHMAIPRLPVKGGMWPLSVSDLFISILCGWAASPGYACRDSPTLGTWMGPTLWVRDCPTSTTSASSHVCHGWMPKRLRIPWFMGQIQPFPWEHGPPASYHSQGGKDTCTVKEWKICFLPL